ncbi:uncharacterized protein LOC144107037 isoform X1 [Amblyomma americanum]
MTVLATFIVFACVVTALGSEAPTGKTASEGTDGYSLLELNSTFRLVDTTLPIQTGNTYRCITATTTEKNDTTHEVTETVEYFRISSDKWESFTQSFFFTCGQDGCNRMNSSEEHGMKIGPPSGSYEFVLRKPNCTILRANYFQSYDNGTAALAERDDEDGLNTGNLQGDCMLWVRNDLPGTPDEKCKVQFEKLCNSTARHHFGTANCQKRSTERNLTKET